MRIGKSLWSFVAMAAVLGLGIWASQYAPVPWWAKLVIAIIGAFVASVVNPVLVRLTGRNFGNHVQLVWLRRWSHTPLRRIEVRCRYDVGMVRRADCEHAVRGAFNLKDVSRRGDALVGRVDLKNREVAIEARMISPPAERVPYGVDDAQDVVERVFVTLGTNDRRPRELPFWAKVLDDEHMSAVPTLQRQGGFKLAERQLTVTVLGWLSEPDVVRVELEKAREASADVVYDVRHEAVVASRKLPPEAFNDLRDVVVLHARPK